MLKDPRLRLLALVLVPCALFLLVSWALSLTELVRPRLVAALLSFMACPLAMMLLFRMEEPFQSRKGWLGPLGFYLGVAALALAFYPTNPGFFEGFRMEGAVEWAVFSVLLFAQVAPVDFFTKRIVQREAAAIMGPAAGQAAQMAAWMVAHVFELFWLLPLWGWGGSLLFLAATGLVSGYIYHRGGSVLAFMVGHWLCNILIAVMVTV